MPDLGPWPDEAGLEQFGLRSDREHLALGSHVEERRKSWGKSPSSPTGEGGASHLLSVLLVYTCHERTVR